MRLLFTALGFVVLVILGGIYGVDHPAIVLCFQQALPQKWVLGTLIALIVSCTVAQRLWRFRQYWRVWAALLAYLLLHFAVAVPVIGKLGLVRYGHIEEFFMWSIALAEGIVMHFVLRRSTASLTPNAGY